MNFRNIPPVVKNILIINALLLLLTWMFNSTYGKDLNDYLALHYFESEHFMPHQFITHMFMHADFMHLFFNMYALWMFGSVLEAYWGSKKFLIYYVITGLGAAALHTAVSAWEISKMVDLANTFLQHPAPEQLLTFTKKYLPQYLPSVTEFAKEWKSNLTNPELVKEATDFMTSRITDIKNVPTVGASGAVFGVLLAFGMLFPNTPLYLFFVPIPIKAKWFVMGYGAIELFYGVSNIPGDNVAHFAHLGGMLFGFILIKYWQNKKNKNQDFTYFR